MIFLYSSFEKPPTATTALDSNSAVASTVPNRIIVIIMGKISKANRKKAPVAAAAATVATTAATPVATAAAATTAAIKEFPESTFFVKAESFDKKGNFSKANKLYQQGIENGCVRCLFKHAMDILCDGSTIATNIITELVNNNINLHLVLPLLLEGAIRGNHDAINIVSQAYRQARPNEKEHKQVGWPLIFYWQKIDFKNNDREQRNQTKEIKKVKKEIGTQCSVCEKKESETVTLLKCDGCHFNFYCSRECQKKSWVEGQHAGVCRQLGILQKYHKPFAKKILKDIVVHRMAPKDIPELQELRRQLGLSRPRADYQDFLEAAKIQQLDQVKLILPRKDGKVQIGSFPRLI